MKIKTEEIFSIQEAMDNLSKIIAIDLHHPPKIGIVKDHKLVIEDEQFTYQDVRWLSQENMGEILDVIKKVYQTLLSHFSTLYRSEEVDWEHPKTRKGIQAMMVLAGEAAEKLDAYVDQVEKMRDLEKITQSKEYKTLQAFYLHKISEKFEKGLEGSKEWEEEWTHQEDGVMLDSEKTGLKDFETVLKDQEYELFQIRNEEGKVFFNSSLLKNMKLVADFDQLSIPQEGDPLIAIRSIQDRDAQSSAHQIMIACQSLIQEFYQSGIRLKEHDLASYLNKALMALMLASSSKNLLQNTNGKSCLEYYQNFYAFLQKCISSSEYKNLLAYPPDPSDQVSHCLLDLVHSLYNDFFFSLGGTKQEMIGLIHRMIRLGEEVTKEKGGKEEIFWSRLLKDGENIEKLLACFPNGPLLKTIDFLRENEEIFFAPLHQGNLPSQIYELIGERKRIQVLRLPSPTTQETITSPKVVEEFIALLRARSQNPSQMHLLINLQDRTSWIEFSRCDLLEKFPKRAEFHSQLMVVTLAKNTDFYHQIAEYQNLDKAEEFTRQLKEQIIHGEECGFYFPQEIQGKQFSLFVDQLVDKIHHCFFPAHTILSQGQRRDFIEIFYHFLTIKLIEIVNPNSLSFTCKDGIDRGAAQSGGFYAFLRLLKGQFEKNDEDFIRWVFYFPALMIRDRGIDLQKLYRMVSSLSWVAKQMQEHGSKIKKSFSELYKSSFFSSIQARQNGLD